MACFTFGSMRASLPRVHDRVQTTCQLPCNFAPFQGLHNAHRLPSLTSSGLDIFSFPIPDSAVNLQGLIVTERLCSILALCLSSRERRKKGFRQAWMVFTSLLDFILPAKTARPSIPSKTQHSSWSSYPIAEYVRGLAGYFLCRRRQLMWSSSEWI